MWGRFPAGKLFNQFIMNITEFAKALNLSKGTVSRALNDRPEVSPETRRYVLEKAEALGFSRNPNARRLATGRTYLLQLECPRNTHILSDQYLVELARALEDTAGDHGFDLLLHLGTRYRSTAEVPAVDGLIVVADAETSPKEIETLTAYGHTPAVVISDTRALEGASQTSYVRIDTLSGVCEALTRIASLGHSRIGYIGSNQALDNMPPVFEKAGLKWNPEFAIQAGITQEQGFAAALRLLSVGPDRRPTVILTRTDILAAGAYQAASQLGLSVPGDISIVGHDDIDLARLLSPPLTTIAINIPNVARAAVEMLTNQIEDKAASAIRVLGTQLVVRGSLGAVPA